MSNNERPRNMMEIITPESGLTMYDEEVTTTTTIIDSNVTESKDANSLEYLPPEGPLMFKDRLGDSENVTFSSESIGPTAEDTGPFTNNSGPSTTTIPEACSDDGFDNELYSRVRKLADMVRKEVNSMNPKEQSDSSSCEKINISLSKEEEASDPSKYTLITEEEEGGVSAIETSSQEDKQMEEKIRKAIIKMKKLDSKLAEVVKKEREIKQRRKQTTNDETNHSQARGSIPLAGGVLCDPPINGNELLFHTQPIERDNKCNDELRVECIESESNSENQSHEELESGSTANTVNGLGSGTSSKHAPKSFIERNKELASEKGEVLMTEDEKKRLEELLNEEEKPENEGEEDEQEREKGRSMIPRLSNGYSFSDEEMNRLDEIDRALERVLPSIDQSSSVLSTMTNNHGSGPGENVLAALQSDRSEQTRLKEINDYLGLLKDLEENDNNNEMEQQPVDCCLTEDQLTFLLEQYHLEQS